MPRRGRQSSSRLKRAHREAQSLARKFETQAFGKASENQFAGAASDFGDALSKPSADAFGTDFVGNGRDRKGIRIWRARANEIAEMRKKMSTEFESAIIKAIEKQNEARAIQATTLGMTTEAADKFRVKQELLNEATRYGVEITPTLTEKIAALAETHASFTQSIEALGPIFETGRPSRNTPSGSTSSTSSISRGS